MTAITYCSAGGHSVCKNHEKIDGTPNKSFPKVEAEVFSVYALEYHRFPSIAKK